MASDEGPIKGWARENLSRQPLPWFTCESVLSEALFVLHEPHVRALDQLLRQDHLRLASNLADELRQVLDLRAKYSTVPMSLADACLVRMSEALPAQSFFLLAGRLA